MAQQFDGTEHKLKINDLTLSPYDSVVIQNQWWIEPDGTERSIQEVTSRNPSSGIMSLSVEDKTIRPIGAARGGA